MKKVRFETPDNLIINIMNESECHSPRPFIERKFCANAPNVVTGIVTFTSDPVQRFECSNSSPYPVVTRTRLPFNSHQNIRLPSNDLDLSMLDSCAPSPRPSRPFCNIIPSDSNANILAKRQITIPAQNNYRPVLSSIENQSPRNVLIKDNGFFIKRDNINQFKFSTYPLHDHFNHLNLKKASTPIHQEGDSLRRGSFQNIQTQSKNSENQTPHQDSAKTNTNNSCECHHCEKKLQNTYNSSPLPLNAQYHDVEYKSCLHALPQPRLQHCCTQPVRQSCSCNNVNCCTPRPNGVDKKDWVIERYEQTKDPHNMEVEKQTNISKEKREPTVADLFKIIKLQNEQLQMLQEKVDKFISVNSQGTKETERIIERVTNEEHKMSIGVMTSFEMVRTSTVINKEIITQARENSHIQCNKSQINIKEVVAKAQPVNLNFLDGITPVVKPALQATQNCLENQMNDDKTLNEYSLYNVQVDNATTPMISPEHSMYLDVRDYSDSDASSDDQSNVGWTYYNKVMTQVNGMLQESDMPSSASALYRNARQCVQMQIDKTNISVTKRVKFGDDPLGIHQPHIYAASTDTSLKMNQLAAKYLKQAPQFIQSQPEQVVGPNDMSIGTKNYMEKYNLLQVGPSVKTSQPSNNLPQFLTNLK